MQDGAGGEEQQALEHGVVHGVEQSGGHAERRGQADGGEHVADLGDTVERKQALEVMLRQRHGDADEHTDAADEHKQKLHCAKSHALEQEVGKTDDAVDTGLCEHAGDEHRDGGRSRAVRIRRQRMEGHDKGLGAEADKEQGKGKLCGIIEIAGDECGELGEVQGMHLSVEHYRADQYAGRTDAADDKVLKRCLKRTGQEPGVTELAETLGTTPEQIALAIRAALPTLSLTPVDDEDGLREFDVPVESPEEALSDRIGLAEVMDRLDSGDRQLIRLRFFAGRTQSETARVLGTTQVQISRRERRILKWMREQLLEAQ